MGEDYVEVMKKKKKKSVCGNCETPLIIAGVDVPWNIGNPKHTSQSLAAH